MSACRVTPVEVSTVDPIAEQIVKRWIGLFIELRRSGARFNPRNETEAAFLAKVQRDFPDQWKKVLAKLQVIEFDQLGKILMSYLKKDVSLTLNNKLMIRRLCVETDDRFLGVLDTMCPLVVPHGK